MNTKEQITECALELFARKGYEGTSVRDIAGAVGIKAGSLYHHFKNKQEIFDSIVEVCFNHANAYFDENVLPFDEADDITIFSRKTTEQLTELILRIFAYFFEDKTNQNFRRLLTISQYENVRAKEVYRKLYRDYPIEFQSRIFTMLMDRGELRKEDPLSLAREFYGTIFMLIHTCDSLEEARPLIEEHVRQFVENYREETL